MYAITATIRQSRRADKPGVIIFRIRDKEGRERMVSSGVQSTLDELITVNRDYALRGLKCLYGVIVRLEKSGNSYNIDDIACEFRILVENGIADAEVADFNIDKSLASVGKPFKEWLDSTCFVKVGYFDGNKLTIENLPGYIAYLLKSSAVSSRTGTVNNYRSTKSAMSEYISAIGGKNSNVIDAKFIDSFNSWLKGQELSASTISFYMRMLRAILNRAKEQGLIDMSENWFSGRITASGPNEDTAKHKALTKDEINLIANMELEPNTLTDLSRDLFMFSFFCRGIELFDILNLTPDNLQGSLIVYRKRLTGKEQVIKIDPQAQRIIDKYLPTSNDYLFSAITNYSKSREYNTLRRLIAPKVAEIGKTLGIKVPLVFSTARSTWTELARASNLSSMMLS